MQIDKINTTLGLLANVGIVVGLFFVILELNQNQKSLNASIQLSLSSAYQEIASRPIENREFAVVLSKIFSRPEDVDQVDTIQVVNWNQEFLSVLYATYELRKDGVISDELWDHNARQFAGFLRIPSYRKIYERFSRHLYPEEFFVEIESKTEE